MNRVVPMLPVRSMPASVEFYQKLGFDVERRDDKWGWALLRADGCHLMLDQSINRHPETPRQTVVYFYPGDIATYHHQVRTAGLAAPEPKLTFYGMREFRLDDPDGNRLWFGQEQAEDS